MAGEYMDVLILKFKRLVKQEYDNGEVIPMNELWNISYGLEAFLDPNKPKLVMAYLYATELTDYIGSDRHNFLLAALYLAYANCDSDTQSKGVCSQATSFREWRLTIFLRAITVCVFFGVIVLFCHHIQKRH